MHPSPMAAAVRTSAGGLGPVRVFPGNSGERAGNSGERALHGLDRSHAADELLLVVPAAASCTHRPRPGPMLLMHYCGGHLFAEPCAFLPFHPASVF